MEKGWEKRVELNLLYPLLVHVNLFGEGYSRQVRKILKDY
jgi:fructosamine-3-kinase